MVDLCAFFVNGHRYGIPVLSVEEIVRPQPITPVPGSDRRLAGIINLRGVSAAVVDLRRCFAGGDGPAGIAIDEGSPMTIEEIDNVSRIGNDDKECRLILMEDQLHLCEEAQRQRIAVFDEPVALLVDSVERVHRLQMAKRHPPPANLRHNFISSVYELADGFLSEISVLSIIEDIISSTEERSP